MDSKIDKEKLAKINCMPDLILKSGIDTFGYVKLEELSKYNKYYKNRENAPYSINEFEVNPINKMDFTEFSQMPNAIVFLLPYYRDNRLDNRGFSIYTRGLDYHEVAKKKIAPIVDYIESLGFMARLFVDSNKLPERVLSIEAKLAKALKSGLVYNEKYGTYFFIAEILTDLDIDILRRNKETEEKEEREEREVNIKKYKNSVDENKFLHSACITCNKCELACPGKVIKGEYLKVNGCLSYLTQSKNLELNEYDKFNGRLFGCDTCQIVCPLNKMDIITHMGLVDFDTIDYIESPNLEEIAFINKETFNKKYKKISASWRGKSLLQRNAIISLIKDNEFKKEDLNKITAPLLKSEMENYLIYRENNNNSDNSNNSNNSDK